MDDSSQRGASKCPQMVLKISGVTNPLLGIMRPHLIFELPSLARAACNLERQMLNVFVNIAGEVVKG